MSPEGTRLSPYEARGLPKSPVHMCTAFLCFFFGGGGGWLFFLFYNNFMHNVSVCTCVFAQEHRKLFGMSEMNAKFRYIELCRSLRTYGVSFFAVKVSHVWSHVRTYVC